MLVYCCDEFWVFKIMFDCVCNNDKIWFFINYIVVVVDGDIIVIGLWVCDINIGVEIILLVIGVFVVIGYELWLGLVCEVIDVDLDGYVLV